MNNKWNDKEVIEFATWYKRECGSYNGSEEDLIKLWEEHNVDVTELKARSLMLPFLQRIQEEEAKICAIICCKEILRAIMPKGARSGEEKANEIFWNGVIEKLKTYKQ